MAEEDIYDIPKITTLQKRYYPMATHGATLQLGMLPVDAFNKSIIIGGNYTYFLSEFTSWEVVNALYAINMETDLRKDLAVVKPDINGNNKAYLDYVNYFITSNIVYTPLYSKNLLFNASIVHSETSFLLGGGMASFQFAGIQPMVSGGLILKFFLGQKTTLKFDFRQHVYFGKAGANGFLSMIGGLEFRFGKEYVPEKKAETLDEIL